jgi:hypothetical protein
MKKHLLFILLFICSYTVFSQAYIPMPVNNVTWRYRTNINSDVVTVSDFLLLLNGQDTIISGNTYYQIISRNASQTGSPGFNPPIVTTTATMPDVYFGGIRESGKQVFFISGSTEQKIFDFNAGIGSYIPSSTSTIMVTSIDSILIGSIYHKRYKTTDSTYYVIEGVGSSRGLIPGLVDGSGTTVFHCFTNEPDTTWSPNLSIPCTYIYKDVYGSSVKAIGNSEDVKFYPNPASETLHITCPTQTVFKAIILNCLGQNIWTGEINSYADIPVDKWAKGIYYMQCRSGQETLLVKKIVVE